VAFGAFEGIQIAREKETLECCRTFAHCSIDFVAELGELVNLFGHKIFQFPDEIGDIQGFVVFARGLERPVE
jgi:hypothetical protein